MGHKLTNQQRREIVAKYREGETAKELALRYGVSEPTIRREIAKHDAKKRCPNCGAGGHNPAARYCWKCGADITPEEIKLAKRVAQAIEAISSLRVEGEHVKTLAEVVRYLEGQAGK